MSVSLPAVSTFAIILGSSPIVSLKSPMRMMSWSSATAVLMRVRRSFMKSFRGLGLSILSISYCDVCCA